MFDLVTKTELHNALAVAKAELHNELTLLEVKIERDLHKLEAKFEAKLGAHTIAIISTVIGAVAASHFWR